jgi:hypothetical protein
MVDDITRASMVALMDMSDIVGLIDAREGPPKKRGPYSKSQPVAEISN